jgi:predicted deacetylase
MPIKIWALLAVLVQGGCSSPKRESHVGHVVVALTIDWEGAYISPDGLDAIDELRRGFGAAPITHFVSAAYFTKVKIDPTASASITQAVHRGDELAVHLHGWRSLAKASGIEPRLSPSFLTGTDKLMEFEDGDVGFDMDLDAYSVTELRAQVRTSRQLLEQLHLPISKTFRAGGYLATPKVLQAIAEEGFLVDSSATDYRQLDERKDEVLPKRIHAIWPGIEPTSQPWWIHPPNAEILELPIAAIADYAATEEIVGVLEAAHARLTKDPSRDVFVVLGFHQETAQDFGKRVGDALAQLRARPERATEVQFTTVEEAARRARLAVSPAPR